MRFTRANSAAQDSGDPVVARPRRRLVRGLSAAAAVAAGSIVIAACGSGSSSSSGGGSSSSTPSTVSGIAQTGPGLTSGTAPTGSKVSGGAVTFAELPATPPNSTFPMYSDTYCGINDIDQLMNMMYRPLYWFGNNYSPTVDYNYSIGQAPTYSNGGKTATIKLNKYMWSNGEQVSARDLVFWMNVLKAAVASNPSNWCGTVPNRFPYNVTSYKAVNPTTFQITFNGKYNPTWLQYNELSQLTPMPLAWDKTSASGATPSATSTTAPDMTASSALKVYNYLQADSLKLSDWSTSPLWQVVDGPWKITSASSNGEVSFAPNTKYSGPDKPQISKFTEIPFTTDTAMFDEVKAGGPSALTVAYLPANDEPQKSSVVSEGYTDNLASSYSVNYFPLNQHNPTFGAVFSQTYFRQAFEQLIDQNGYIQHILNGTAVNTSGSIPSAPPSKVLAGITSTSGPYPYSIAGATKLLTDNGWKVVPGGTTTCVKPGSAAGDCGAGVKKGLKLSFNLDYASGTESIQTEMIALQSAAKQVGIELQLTSHPFDAVIGTGQTCKSTAPTCKWTAENWGAGWIYAPDYFPTGESLFATGAASNSSSYSNPEMDKLIANTITASSSGEKAAMATFYKYTQTQVPLTWGPTQVGTFGGSAGTLLNSKLGGYTANAFGNLTPEQWYLTK